jgi:hypothetical protein
MNLKNLGITFGIVAALGGTGAYVDDVIRNPEHRGLVGDLSSKVIDFAFYSNDKEELKFESAKTRAVFYSCDYAGKFFQYIDLIFGKKAGVLTPGKYTEYYYQVAQVMKSSSIDEMKKSSGLEDDELRGFFLRFIEGASGNELIDPVFKVTTDGLKVKSIQAAEKNYRQFLVRSLSLRSAIETDDARLKQIISEYGINKHTSAEALVSALGAPKTDFQKDPFNQSVVRAYLIQEFNYKESDLTSQKLQENVVLKSTLDALKIRDRLAYTRADRNLNCVGAFTTAAYVSGEDKKMFGVTVNDGLNHYIKKVNDDLGVDGGLVEIAKYSQEAARIFLSPNGPEIMSAKLLFCAKNYEWSR